MDLIYWIWLSMLKGIGPINAKKLLETFKTPKNIYNVPKKEVREEQHIPDNIMKTILNSKDLEGAKNILEKCKALDIKLLTYYDNLYPKEVRLQHKSPILLYYRGNIINNSIGISIVGSRRCTEYGKRVTVEVAEFLAQNRIPIISGMAKGIDAYAHTACVNANGYTIAFLGNSVDICYPKEQSRLMEKIIEKGAVISQYPPTTKPLQYNFPERNYLISAWCKKLLVVEAGQKSGALSTAEFAKQQLREVFVVPSGVYVKESLGSNELIASGCKIYLNPKQLVDANNERDFELNIKKRQEDVVEVKPYKGTVLENSILRIIKDSPKTLDEIIISIKEEKQKLIEIISTMELEGKIESRAGYWRYNEKNML